MKKISKHISWKEGTFSNTAKSLKINNKPTKGNSKKYGVSS